MPNGAVVKPPSGRLDTRQVFMSNQTLTHSRLPTIIVSVVKKSEQELVSEVESRLVSKFTQLPRERVAAAVEDARSRFEHSVIRDFIPLLIERRVSSELTGVGVGEPATVLA
jgi:CRISPR/Cas system-associated exonuclease Cas4 (RecB family)